jgi:integrase
VAGDVIRMGWQHIGHDRLIRIKQEKTGEAVAIPVGPDLQRVLDALPRTDLTFVVSKTGQPFKAVNYYDRYFREWCDAAGLPPRCSSHGLRYAMVRRLVEAGKTPWEIASITGHRDLRMIQHYARQHEKEGLAHRAIAAVTALETGTQSV